VTFPVFGESILILLASLSELVIFLTPLLLVLPELLIGLPLELPVPASDLFPVSLICWFSRFG
jgi:hypothetical protein